MELSLHEKTYQCLSTEKKKCPPDSYAELLEIDTGKVFHWYKGRWVEAHMYSRDTEGMTKAEFDIELKKNLATVGDIRNINPDKGV